MNARKYVPGRGRGISVFEILLVGVLFAVLAVAVVPKVTTAGGIKREQMLWDNLHLLRTQILMYRHDHRGRSPGYPQGDTASPPTQEAMARQLAGFTDANGHVAFTASRTYRFGPYLGDIPANPLAGNNHVRLVADDEPFPAQPQGSEGWLYQPSTATIVPNTPGVDLNGRAYFDY